MSQEYDRAVQAPATSADRQKRRFARRWKRRLSILAPFLGIPLLFGALALSMGVVRHIPQAEAARAQGRAVKARPLARSNRHADRLAVVPPKANSARLDSISEFDPTSIALEISDVSPKAARIPPSAYRGSNTR